MGNKRVGWARIKSLINENANQLQPRRTQYQTISSDTTLTMADSGGVIGCNGASVLVITLPNPDDQAGASFRFHLTDNTANVSITVDGADTDFVGSVKGLSSGDTATSSDTFVRFVASTAVAGDYIELISNGANWFVSGHAIANGGIVFGT